MRRSRPFTVIFELNDRAPQPAVIWSDRSNVFQICGCGMAPATQVGPRHTTSVAPRYGKEWQSRTTFVAEPGSAPIASGAALRVDQINGELSGMSEGVDYAPGI